MFTGLVEAQGTLLSKSEQPGLTRLRFAHAFAQLKLGESIAVSGACLTVVSFSAEHFDVELSSETLALTTLGQLRVGDPVNFERALLASDRLGGHVVTGHVDGLGSVVAKTADGSMTHITLALPAALLPYVAKKGSITVDGVSLTINDVNDAHIELLLIPHTQAVTTLGRLQPGSQVNLEADIVARYVERILTLRTPS